MTIKSPLNQVRAVCFDWGGTLMPEQGGPEDVPMALWPSVTVFDGAEEALSMLYGRLPLAVATNASISKRSMVEMALRRVGLAKYFDEIFCYTDLGYRKDQRQFWDAVETGLRVPKSQIAMVGDSYEQDALAPRLFGVQGVWLNRGVAPQSERSASPVTDSLGEFSRWVLSAT